MSAGIERQYTEFVVKEGTITSVPYNTCKSRFLNSDTWQVVGSKIREKKKREQGAASKIKENKHSTKYQRKINVKKAKANLYKAFSLRAFAKPCLLTISFPINTSDQLASRLLNNWLTQLRKIYSFLDYYFVAERQKNGTIHYHIVLNKFLPISKLRAMMQHTMKAHTPNWASYNGMDIKKIFSHGIKLYLVKYLNKAPITVGHSKRIGQLFAATVQDSVKEEDLGNIVYFGDFCTSYENLGNIKQQHYTLVELNNRIYYDSIAQRKVPFNIGNEHFEYV